ncbi:MAG: hypothetical protein ACOYXA_09015 [Bacteroidota bacterium]
MINWVTSIKFIILYVQLSGAETALWISPNDWFCAVVAKANVPLVVSNKNCLGRVTQLPYLEQ